MENHSELTQLLRGRGAHADPLACIEDLTPEVAVRQVDGFPHSIFALVYHINYWMDYELRRVNGKKPAYPEHAAASWPSQAETGEWPTVAKRCRQLLDRYAALAKSPSEEMQRNIEATYPGHLNLASSLSAVLWQIVAHNSYHVGQIVMLRQALGVWPPPQGGDTW
jgi:uncharacterized damage-inducible protein DinB